MNELSAEFWSKRYQKQQTGWDLGQISPPLKSYFDQLTNKNLKILIPGCGRGHEGIYLWEQGFRNVYFADFSPEAIQFVRDRIPELPEHQLFCQDFFSIQNDFDMLIEQTMFCAIDPKRRKEYVQKSASLLRSNGKKIGLLFNREFEGGPPFGGSKNEYLALYSDFFEIITMETCYNSIEPRKGNEVFFIAKKRN